VKNIIRCQVVWVALLVVVLGSPVALSQSGTEGVEMLVTRSISTAYAIPESVFQVTLVVKAKVDLYGVGIRETLPINWTIQPVENAGAAFKRSGAEWVFEQPLEAGTTSVIVYEVAIPSAEMLLSDPLPQCFTIQGTYQATVPSIETAILGDSSLEVSSTLPIPTVIAHLVPSPDGQSDTIDLRMSQKLSKEQLDRALDFWRFDFAVPGTGGEQINLAMMEHLTALFETCTPAMDPLPLSIDPTLLAVRTIDTFLPCDSVLMFEGNRDPGLAARQVTVHVRITPLFDAYGVGLKEWFPTAWQVTPIQHNGFVYRPSEKEWVYPAKVQAGETLEVVYVVEVVPTSWDFLATSGSCCGTDARIIGETSAGLECSVAPVVGEDAVLVQSCVPVLLAISRWDVDNDRFDATLSNIITRPQMQRALAFWEETAPVPHTCGYTVGWHMLKLITAYWQSGTPITQSLPVGVLETCGDALQECGIPDCVDGSLCGLVNAQDSEDYVGLP
jgi:hypothetical protein